jgi:hypothetical protein
LTGPRPAEHADHEVAQAGHRGSFLKFVNGDASCSLLAGGAVYRAASLGWCRRRKAATLWRLAQRWLP